MVIDKPLYIKTFTAIILLGATLITLALLMAGCAGAGYNDRNEEMQKTAGECSGELDTDPFFCKDDIQDGTKSNSDILSKEQLEPVKTDIQLSRWKPMKLIIPAINLEYKVASDRHSYDPELTGNEPWKFSSEDYNNWIRVLMSLLNKGPVHYQFSALPGTQAGNVVIAGHSPSPWYHFYDLDSLSKGDEIFLETAGYRFVYRVQDLKIVDKYDWSPLFETDYPAITFQTCHPKDYAGYDHPERLMVRASLDEVYLLAE